MKKKIYNTPIISSIEVTLATTICASQPPGAGPEGGEWEAPARVAKIYI